MKRGIVLTVAFAATFMTFSSVVGGAGPSLMWAAHARTGVSEPAPLGQSSAATAFAEQMVERSFYSVTSPPAPDPTTWATPNRSVAGSAAHEAIEGAAAATSPPEMTTLPAVWNPPTGSPSAPSCPAAISGTVFGAPSAVSPQGVLGTTTGDLQLFATTYNEIRIANCLHPVPLSNFRYDSCMEARLFWMAEDPSTDPSSAWGHTGAVRSDGVPIVGCDGNLAGGSGNTGATVAQKWWSSGGHRESLYRPTITGEVNGTCIYFAMTHGGVPNEPQSFTRAAARWGTC